MHRWTCAAAVVVIAVTAAAGCSDNDTGTSAEAATATSGAPATTASSATTTADAAGTVFDSASVSRFPVAMQLQLPANWIAQEGAPGTIDVIHTGNPPDDKAQWWGPAVAVIDDAQVRDPATFDNTGLPPARDDYITMPDDYLAYVTALPGIQVVDGPDPITLGGNPAQRLVVDMPADAPPLLWMPGDGLAFGGAAQERLRHEITVIDVGGQHVMLDYADLPATFDERRADVDAMFDTVTFTE